MIFNLCYLDLRAWHRWRRNRFGHEPARLFEADILVNPQFAARRIQNVADLEGLLALAQRDPCGVR